MRGTTGLLFGLLASACADPGMFYGPHGDAGRIDAAPTPDALVSDGGRDAFVGVDIEGARACR